MAHPTDIYVALSDAPAGIEDTFEVFKPTAERIGNRLALCFDVPTDERDAATLRGEIALRLKGCEYYYAELAGEEKLDVLYDAGDMRHIPIPEAPVLNVYVAAQDLEAEELDMLCERFNVEAVYTHGEARLAHITSYQQRFRWNEEDQCDELAWPEFHSIMSEIAYYVESRHGFNGLDPMKSPVTWCAATSCGAQAGEWHHPLWQQFGMQVEKTFNVTFG